MSGTAVSSNLGFFGWSAESSFGENATTYSVRHQIRNDQIDVSGLARQLVNRGGTFQRLNEGTSDVPGAYGTGSFSITLDAYGHGSTTAGALTEPNLAKLLAHVFGNSDWTQDGGQLTAGGTLSATQWYSTNVSTALVGGLFRIGALGDGRCEGQAIPVSAFSASQATCYHEMASTPTAADTAYAMGMIYPMSASANSVITADGSTSNNTLRCILSTGNLQFAAHGCVCTGVSLTGTSPGEIPQWELTFSCAWWQPISVTYPSATATSDYMPAVTATGSLHIQDNDTDTRTVDIVREFSIEIGHQIVPLMGDGGVEAGQNVVGWRRVPAPTRVSFAVEAQAATASPTWWTYAKTDPNSIVHKEGTYTLNTTDGSALALYFPNLKPVEVIPTQTSIDGVNYVRATFEALTNTVTTSELTLSAWRLGMG